MVHDMERAARENRMRIRFAAGAEGVFGGNASLSIEKHPKRHSTQFIHRCRAGSAPWRRRRQARIARLANFVSIYFAFLHLIFEPTSAERVFGPASVEGLPNDLIAFSRLLSLRASPEKGVRDSERLTEPSPLGCSDSTSVGQPGPGAWGRARPGTGTGDFRFKLPT